MKHKAIEEWALWEVLIPLIAIAIWWPVGTLRGLDHSFERTFATGELIIFASLLALSVRARFRDRQSLAIEVLLAYAFIGFMWFGFVKSQTMEEKRFIDDAAMTARLWRINCAGSLLAVVLGAYIHAKEGSQ